MRQEIISDSNQVNQQMAFKALCGHNYLIVGNEPFEGS